MEAARNEEEVGIAMPQKPSLMLVRVASAPVQKTEGQRLLGAGRGEMRPVSDEEWQSKKHEMQDQMLHNLLITQGEA